MKQIIQNEAKCKKCGDIIYSAHTHDFVACSCRSIFVDGGMEYIRRVGDLDNIEDRSMCMEKEDTIKLKEVVEDSIKSGRNSFGIGLAVIRFLRDNDYLNMDKFKDE